VSEPRLQQRDTRERPAELQRLAESLLATSTKAALIVWCDEDQIVSYAEGVKWGPRVVMHGGTRIGPVAAANSLCHLYRDPIRIYGMVPDDAIFKTPGWDDYIIKTFEAMPRRIGVIAAAHNGGEYVNFPWVSREWIESVGWLYYPHNFHHCCDSILEILGECTNMVYAKPEEFSMHHELVTTFNREKFVADCYNFLAWAVGERRTLVKRIRERIAGAD